jgi:uncharacterized protein (UPF0332 family)
VVVQVAVPDVVCRELLRRAEGRGMSISEYLAEIAVEGLDPLDAALSYIEGAKDLLRQARIELERGDLRQASEKVWGACALAIKAHALRRRGRRIESHAELWAYKNEVARELGDWVRAVFRQADSMHKNFYENLATREDVEDALQEVEKLVKAVDEALAPEGDSKRVAEASGGKP